jgi:hypothetical protein
MLLNFKTMNNKFIEVMQDKSSEELFFILNNQRDDYQPEAIDAIENVLKNRNLSEADLQIIRNAADIKKQEQTEKSNIPLETVQKILFFLFFYGVIPWAIAGTFKAKGFERKYKEAWKAMKWGLIVFLIFALLMIFILQ